MGEAISAVWETNPDLYGDSRGICCQYMAMSPVRLWKVGVYRLAESSFPIREDLIRIKSDLCDPGHTILGKPCRGLPCMGYWRKEANSSCFGYVYSSAYGQWNEPGTCGYVDIYRQEQPWHRLLPDLYYINDPYLFGSKDEIRIKHLNRRIDAVKSSS